MFLKAHELNDTEGRVTTVRLQELIEQPVNLVSVIFAQVYFPTFSNGLKEIAASIGFRWSLPEASGAHAIKWRHEWEHSNLDAMKQRLYTYNANDCIALERLTKVILQISSRLPSKQNVTVPVVNVDRMPPEKRTKWRAVQEFDP